MLYIIQIGRNDASNRYIRNKVKAVEEAGLKATVVNLHEECTTNDILDAMFECEMRVDCKALMVQLPLPSHIDKDVVLRNIPESIDIDGLNPRTIKYKPLTPCAIMRWLKEQNVNLEGKRVAILGRSELVGKPLANLMIDAGATVSVYNSKSLDLDRMFAIRSANVVISAVGKPDLITHKDVQYGISEGRIFIDVGINRDKDGKLCGDISKEAAEHIRKHGSICTPVPGGVGKWTVRELVLRLKEMEVV